MLPARSHRPYTEGKVPAASLHSTPHKATGELGVKGLQGHSTPERELLSSALVSELSAAATWSFLQFLSSPQY